MNYIYNFMNNIELDSLRLRLYNRLINCDLPGEESHKKLYPSNRDLAGEIYGYNKTPIKSAVLILLFKKNIL